MSLVRRARNGVPPAPASRIAPGRIEHFAIGSLRRQPWGIRHQDEGQSIGQAPVWALQGHQAPRRGQSDLREPETQAAAGV